MPLCFVDLETGGFNPYKNPILEVCAKKVNSSFSTIEKFYTKVKPAYHRGMEIDPEVIPIIGYDEETWKSQGRDIESVMVDLHKFLEGVTFVGQNPVFDWSFIEYNLFLSGMDRPNMTTYHLIDLSSMVYHLELDKTIPNTRLKTLCEYFKVTNKKAHTAESDVDATIELFKKIKNNYFLQKIPF